MYLHREAIAQEIILRRDPHLQTDQEACLHREAIAQEVTLHRDHLQADLEVCLHREAIAQEVTLHRDHLQAGLEVCRHRDLLQVDQVGLPEVVLLEVALQKEVTKIYTYN